MDSGKENRDSLHALVACGENSMKDLFTAGLEDTFSVVGVDSAREAIGYLMTRSIHILVTCLELSDVDGWRLIRMVRSGRFCAGTLPIVVVHDEFTIPSSLANEHNISTISLDEVDLLSEVAKASLQGSPNPRILIIEDDRNAANLARLALEKQYTVEMAPDGDSGLEAWKAYHHDLVLLDVMLPGLSGPQVLQQILSVEPDQLVVILTAYATTDRHQELMLAGASEFLSKPFSIDKLRETCAHVLRHRDHMSHYATLQHEVDTKQELGNRIQVAKRYLSSGQVAMADYHLKHALAVCASAFPSDDEWAKLLTEFDETDP
jgi:DNA-binding response OmpR family regulator